MYSGDTDFTGSTGTEPAGLSVTKAATSTVETVTPSTAPYGTVGAVTLSAQVMTAGAGTPTGSVAFTSNGTTLCTKSVSTLVGVTSASCALPATDLPASATPYDITATYSGDGSFTTSADTLPGALTITQAATSATILSSPASTVYGNESSVSVESLRHHHRGRRPTGTCHLHVERGDTVHRHPRAGLGGPDGRLLTAGHRPGC